MLQDKAMIIIAVSKYTGAYKDLPGTITSARRLREWAEQPSEDCNYNVLYLDDDNGKKVNTERVKKEVTHFVNNNFIDRLVVYFAGHGIVRSAGDQFWLLTDAAIDTREGINVEAFRRGLLKCNISNANIAGQLCIIGDACRNTGRDAIEFYGDPILTSSKMKNRSIQLDRYLSTGLGSRSFQINQTDSQSAYCLFSEVMLAALNGEVPDAIETEFHKFQPVVTNHKLAEYLEKEVKTRAAAIQVEMEPDLLTSIRPPYNFYKKIESLLDMNGASLQNPQLTSVVQMAVSNSPKEESDDRLTGLQERRRQTFLRWKNLDTFMNFPLNRELRVSRRHYFTISDFPPNSVAVPSNTNIEVIERRGLYGIVANNSNDSPILIRLGERWILTPNFLSVANVISRDLPGDILFLKTRRSFYRDKLLDTYLSDFSNLVGSVPLRAADARKFADNIRIGKEKYPHQAVTAGYLYEFSNDYDNIARTAHYMAYSKGIPFDLALLCADKIWWRKENGRSVAFADLPAVEPSQTNDNEEYRPYYTKRGFEERKNVRLWGIAPIFRQGWSFMQTELYLEIPEEIRQIGENMSGRSAANLTEKGLEMFLEAFDYRVIETGT